MDPLLPTRPQTQHLPTPCLRRILGITLQDRVPNKDVFAQARLAGHVSRMGNGRIPRDIFYGELATGSRSAGRPNLRFKDVCKRDLKAGDINPTVWEALRAFLSFPKKKEKTTITFRLMNMMHSGL